MREPCVDNKPIVEAPVGEIHADVTLENAGDREYFRRGDRAEADIRRSKVDGIVDTGAVTLVLPQNVVERLGLQTQGTAVVTCADERREERPLAGPVVVQIGNRSMTIDCIVHGRNPSRVGRTPTR